MDPNQQFELERRQRILELGRNNEFKKLTTDWLEASMRLKYVYNFSWLGRPIIQYPQDMIAVQELLWEVKPDLVVETGIAHGGSLILSASILALLDLCEGKSPQAPPRKVLGIDIDIRTHNREAITEHPLADRIEMIEGSSIAEEVVSQVHATARGAKSVMVFLDSMHTDEHVYAELEAYAGLVTPGSYCVVFDTFVDDLPSDLFLDRPWDRNNNPKVAVKRWLAQHPEFRCEQDWDDKLSITASPGGFLKRLAG